MLKRLFILGAAVTSAAACAGFMAARTLWRTWGVVPTDTARTLPGDDLVADAKATDTRTIEIDAPPSRVWPWLVQMGYGRAGWYSYDQMDTSHPSLDRVAPELQSLAVGDVMPTHPGGGFEVRALEPEQALVLYTDRASLLAQAERTRAAAMATEEAPANLKATGAALERPMPSDFAASWAFVVEPTGEGHSRLVERFRIRMEPPADGRPLPPFAGRMLGFGVFVVTRRQMLGIKSRVEGTPETGFLGRALRSRNRMAPAG